MKNRPCLRTLLAAAALWAAGGAALAQGATVPPTLSEPPAAAQSARALDPSDRKFIEAAAQGGMAEVELGRIARQRATDGQVKAFAERMVEDHGKANEELMRLVASTGVPLPAAPDRAQQNQAAHLAGLAGREFDVAYMQHMVADHEKDVAAFEQAARAAADPEVKALAAKTLPVLQAHLLQARATYDMLRKQPASKLIAAPR